MNSPVKLYQMLFRTSKETVKFTLLHLKKIPIYITFTFMHLADAFIQSDLMCIQAMHYLPVCVFLGNLTFCAANAMLYHWATGCVPVDMNLLVAKNVVPNLYNFILYPWNINKYFQHSSKYV